MPESVQTVRIPELPPHVGALSLDSLIPVWNAENNTTESISLQTIQSIVQSSGSGDAYDPVYVGGTLIYVVPAEKEGDDYVNIPAIKGMNFKLIRDATLLLPGTEFKILDTGGFKLMTDETGYLIAGQRFELTVFELTDGSIPGASASGSFLSQSVRNINTNKAISVDEVGKILRLRGGANSLTLSLPDGDLVPQNGIIVIESIISNTRQHKISTSSAQYIYHNNKSVDHIWIGVGETIWLQWDTDGWYMIKGEDYFRGFLKPLQGYKADINENECEGQIALRADYPRIWEEIEQAGSSLVSDALWNTASVTVGSRVYKTPYIGCFSTGDGSTTFRFPDLRDSTIAGLKNYPSTDAERYYNHSGGFQEPAVESHRHLTVVDSGQTTDDHPSTTLMSSVKSILRFWNRIPSSAKESYELAASTNEPTVARTSAYGGAKTRMQNIGLRFFMKY
ncbi:MAG TPA: hypothetical protein PL085_11520 [Agriterribacter sp.]|uniref:hypothetical protein n=1 Tax=Agriterribacter sp. TaxID=2821509 RepID=UPI002D171250|nr:hypothetical protein [Agriterribacter sp.]HRQ17698.1 hypothetical protein [Agriterribacter sp.]